MVELNSNKKLLQKKTEQPEASYNQVVVKLLDTFVTKFI